MVLKVSHHSKVMLHTLRPPNNIYVAVESQMKDKN